MTSVRSGPGTPPTPVRVGVAGLGVIGRQHLRLIEKSPDFDLVAVADPVTGAGVDLPAGVPRFDDFRVMIEQTSPAAVIIAAPNQAHSEIALHCVERGIPVLIEKPIAATLDDAAAIVAAVESTGVPALIGHHRRHSPDMTTARRMVLDGELGELVTVNGIWMARKPDDYFATPWRVEPGGGPVMINLIHEIDCLRFLAGEIDTVHAMAANNARNLSVEDAAAVCIRFSNGAVGTLIISDSTPSPWIWDIASGQGADFPHQYGDCFHLGGTSASMALPTLRKYWQSPGRDWREPLWSTTAHATRSDCYQDQLAHFARVVRGQAQPACSAEDGFRTLAATIAVAESAASGATVAVADLLSSRA